MLQSRTSSLQTIPRDVSALLKGAPVVQTLDDAIHGMNHYPADQY